MKEHPIIFSTEMVRAILDGRKTQTRRVIKIPKWIKPPYEKDDFHTVNHPYGKVGDTLWVRETWDFRPMGGALAKNRIAIVGYKADDATKSVCVPEDCNSKIHKNWRSPIHMFQWAARIFLEITNIRVERVQDISDRDACAEGINRKLLPYAAGDPEKRYLYDGTAIALFKNLWDSLNAKRGYGWDKNPWVWVIEFRKRK